MASPILLASTDETFLPSEPLLREQIQEQHDKRGDDNSPATQPGGNFISFRVVRAAQALEFYFDLDFLDDGKGGIDESKRESPTAADYLAAAKWRAKLNAAELLRPDLAEATFMYRWFLSARGGRVWSRARRKITRAFGRRCIAASGVARRSNTPVCSTPRALLASRIGALGAPAYFAAGP